MSTTRLRTTVRSAVAAAFVLTLAAGCGANDSEAPAEEQTEQAQQTEQADESDTDGQSASDGGGDDTAAGGASDGGGAAAGGSDDLPADADLAAVDLPIPAEDAVATALETAGGGDLHQVEIDHDRVHGWMWEIQVQNGAERHELDIHAITGEVIQHERDDEDDQDPAVDIAAPLPHQEAVELALGAQDGRVSGWTLESDDDRIHYRVDIVPEGRDDDVNVEVDVETREVRVDD